MGDIEKAVSQSIDEALKRGVLDKRLHAAPIAVMLNIARTIDLPTFPMVADNRYDNVSIPTLLRYMAACGLTIADPKPRKVEKEARSKLESMRDSFHVA
jgi:hypothetical protein